MTIPSCFHSFPNDNHVRWRRYPNYRVDEYVPFLDLPQSHFKLYENVHYYKNKMKWEESAMLSISTSNTPNRSKTVTKDIIEHDQHSLKRQKLEIISTSLSQFIWFPRFHHFICICSFILCDFQSIHSMMLQTLWRIQPACSQQ